MNSRNNRDRVRDPREEILLETNFDDDGVLTRAYNNHQPNRRRSTTYRSDHSLDRYSDMNGKKEGACCQRCMTRVPYATLIATILCMLGVLIFCSTFYRGATVSIIMANLVFHLRLKWMEILEMTFLIIAVAMAALGFMILFVGTLATGATRHRVYTGIGSRVGGRISCAVLLGMTYFFTIAWMLIFSFLSIISFVFTMFWNLCNGVSPAACINFSQYRFMFPEGIPEDDLKVCERYEIKAFCKDGVENGIMMFVIATVASLLVILSLIQYLMCLSANYAHIRDHEKFQELQEMTALNQLHYSTSSKDRF